MRRRTRTHVPTIAVIVWLAGAALAPGLAAPATDREARAQRAAEIVANLRSYHQSAVADLERPDYDKECSDIVHISTEVIKWSVSDKGMLTGEETPWSDKGLPDVELTPEEKNTLREIAGDLLADIANRLGRRGGDACFPPPANRTAESTGRQGKQDESSGFILPGIVRNFLGLTGSSTPDDGRDDDLEERIAELEATTARKGNERLRGAELPPLIIVVINPDGTLFVPGTGTCFGQAAQNGNLAKANCPRGMPAETQMRHAIRQYFSEPEPLRDQFGRLMFDSEGRPILYPSWSDFQVTPEYAETLKSADEPLYLPYKWSNASSEVVWTQEDIGKTLRQWAGTPPDGGLSNEDIDRLQKMQIDAPPVGSLKPDPNAGKATPKATGTRQSTTQPAPRRDAGDQIMKGLIQFGVGTFGDSGRADRRRDDHHRKKR